MSAFHSFLKYLHYRQRQTAVTLKIQNFGLARLGTARFLTLRCPCLGFDRYWRTTGIDQLTHRCVMFRQLVFLNFTAEDVVKIDCGFVYENTTIFTFCVDCVGQTYASLFRGHV